MVLALRLIYAAASLIYTEYGELCAELLAAELEGAEAEYSYSGGVRLGRTIGPLDAIPVAFQGESPKQTLGIHPDEQKAPSELC